MIKRKREGKKGGKERRKIIYDFFFTIKNAAQRKKKINNDKIIPLLATPKTLKTGTKECNPTNEHYKRLLLVLVSPFTSRSLNRFSLAA